MENLYLNENKARYASLSYLKKNYPEFSKYWSFFLEKNSRYNTTRLAPKKFQRLSYFSTKIDQNFQIDLMYVSSIGKYNLVSKNKGVKYLLIIVCTTSTKIYIYPLKTKTAKAVSIALEHFLVKLNKLGVTFFSDHGTEFLGLCKNVFKKYKAIHYTGLNEEIKASLAENKIKHFKMLLWKIIINSNDLEYISKLPEIVDILNSRVHSRYNISPKNINEFDIPHIFNKKHDFSILKKKPKFKKNDTVQILKKSDKLGVKQTEQKYTEEHFIIDKIFHTVPVQYAIKDICKNDIAGKFYEPELIRKIITKNTFYPFKILKENAKNVYVNFIGWPDSYNAWVSKKSVKNIE